jgi:ComF family protein
MAEKNLYVNALLELFYPRICVVCGQKLISTESFVCLKCLLHLPRTNYHNEPENRMEMLFYGRVRIEKAGAFFEFRKGSPYQKILHHLKYKGKKELGEMMGKQFALNLIGSEFIKQVDLICPVPLHPKKQRKRGYNQSYHLAKGLSDGLGIPVDSRTLQRKIHTDTQTKRSRYERWENVDGIFEITDPKVFENKHVLLVDDVVTTGSTLEACAQTILKSCQAKVSLAALAIA